MSRMARQEARAEQAGVGLRARQQNLLQRMRVARCPPDGWLVIIDDVVTTGSTITEAQLKAAGVALRDPAALRHLKMPIAARLRRLSAAPVSPGATQAG